MEMTSRERLSAAYRGQQPDRVPVRVWGVTLETQPVHPSYAPIIEAAQERTDLVGGWGMPGGIFLSATDEVKIHTEEGPSEHEGFGERMTTYETPEGLLTQVDLFSLEGKPGYRKKYLIETEEDARRFMSIPYVPVEGDVSGFFEADGKMGDRGVVMAGIGAHPMYAIQATMGSETFAFWSVERRDLLLTMVDTICERTCHYVKYFLDRDVGPFFSYVGPELCIPPLQSVRDFYDFVVHFDRKWIELIHENDGVVWCHSHGDMDLVFEGFIETGVDCLQPLEPPPWGNIALADAKRRAAGRMALEGNIEKHELYRSSPEEIRARVIGAIQDAAPGGGFILGASAGVQEWPVCTERTVQNFLTYIETGVAFGRGSA